MPYLNYFIPQWSKLFGTLFQGENSMTQFSNLRALLLFVTLLFLFPLKGMAGPQYVDKSDFAVSGYDVVAYRSLESKSVGETQTEAIPGRSDITAEWNDAKWAFSTVENRDKFLENPEYYAPEYNGHCAYGVSLNGKVPANPHLWRIVDDRLFLNVTTTVVGLWEEDISGHITNADKNWGSLEKKSASRKKVPKLNIKLAPTK